MISLRCPDCNRQLGYIRMRTGEGICQVCGRIMTPAEVKAQKEEQKAKLAPKDKTP